MYGRRLHVGLYGLPYPAAALIFEAKRANICAAHNGTANVTISGRPKQFGISSAKKCPS
jgi:hypothetical protein